MAEPAGCYFAQKTAAHTVLVRFALQTEPGTEYTAAAPEIAAEAVTAAALKGVAALRAEQVLVLGATDLDQFTDHQPLRRIGSSSAGVQTSS